MQIYLFYSFKTLKRRELLCLNDKISHSETEYYRTFNMLANFWQESCSFTNWRAIWWPIFAICANRLIRVFKTLWILNIWLSINTEASALGLVDKFNFNYMTRLGCISLGNFILKLVCFLQLFYLSTPLVVIWHFLSVKIQNKRVHKVLGHISTSSFIGCSSISHLLADSPTGSFRPNHWLGFSIIGPTLKRQPPNKKSNRLLLPILSICTFTPSPPLPLVLINNCQ